MSEPLSLNPSGLVIGDLVIFRYSEIEVFGRLVGHAGNADSWDVYLDGIGMLRAGGHLLEKRGSL